MSCPKCGSGAVFHGKCRECGAVVDSRRASSVAVRVAPAPERKRTGVVEKAAPSRPPPPPARDQDATNPGHPAPSRPDEPDTEERGAPEHGGPWKNPDRVGWYAAAGMEPPSEAIKLGSELDEPSTRHNVVPMDTSAVILLAVAATAQVSQAALGQSLVGLPGAVIAALAAFLLWRRSRLGRPAAWLYGLWSVAWAFALAAILKMPVQGVLAILPAVCVMAALHAGAAAVRWIAGGLGAGLALLGLAPHFAALRSPPRAEEVAIDGSSYTDARLGFSLKVPEGVSILSAERAKDLFPPGWSDLGPRLVFAAEDRGIVGGLLVAQQAGTSYSNLLARVNLGGEGPIRNDSLAPASLREASRARAGRSTPRQAW